jgi:hypothetical protein
MIDFGPFQFASAPGTGVEWFLETCKLAGFPPETGLVDCSLAATVPFGVVGDSKLRVTLVRHPLEILLHYHVLPSCTRPTPFDMICTKTPEAFVQVVAALHPGIVGKLIDSYKANTVIRWEDMPHAAVELFASLGVSNPMLNAIYNKPLRLRKENWRDWAGTATIRAVAESEKEMMEKYDYAW